MIGVKSNLGVAELSLEVARERVDPDALDGLSVAMQSVELTATVRAARSYARSRARPSGRAQALTASTMA
jgi:hypothetical protein